ncbi:MAG: hypothetical protein HQ593_00870 [Candidatus Omnitrophica bacterium]|nr:hypothetical protein [Candidatus Omnitrophota bacterium]
MKRLFSVSILLSVISIFIAVNAGFCDDVIYGFEKDGQGWAIPDWACEKIDYVCKTVEISSDAAIEGSSSLKLDVDFPKEAWRAAVIEVEDVFYWEEYNFLFVDIYLPDNVPNGISGRFAMTVGDDWLWIEPVMPVNLMPGKWVTVQASLRVDNVDWKKTEMVEERGIDGKIRGYVKKEIPVILSQEYKDDIHTIAVRIEADRIKYEGPVYIDNIRLVKELPKE